MACGAGAWLTSSARRATFERMTGDKIESKIKRDAAKRARQRHLAKLARTECPAIWRGIESLLEPPYTPERLIAFFENRVTYGMIRHWRYGRSKPPAWACRLVADRLDARARLYLKAARAVEKAFGIGRAHDKEGKHLARWRAEQAAA